MPLLPAMSILGFPSAVGLQSTSGTLSSSELAQELVCRPPLASSAAGFLYPISPRREGPWGWVCGRLDPHLGCPVRLTFVLLAQEEGDDCTLSIYRRLHNSLERSELSVTQGPPEPGRTRAEQRLRPTRPCAEDN